MAFYVGVPDKAIYPRENGGGDGGYGVMQLTQWYRDNVKVYPDYLQIWNWKENINTAINEVIRSKLAEAKNWHDKWKNECRRCKPRIKRAYPEAANYPLSTSKLRKDAYSLYNSGYHYWVWNDKKGRWINRAYELKEIPDGTKYTDHAEDIKDNGADGF